MSTKTFKCPFCDFRAEREELPQHIEDEHEECIPKGMTATRIVFNMINHKDHGTCVVCKRPTRWNEVAGKYDRLCGRPQCRQALRDSYKKNMVKVHGKTTLLNDPEQQEKMLANRHISGKYKFADGGYHIFTGSYEEKTLEFLDKVMGFKSTDIFSPGPTIEYEFKGKKLKWITDILLIPFNLIIEVKDGGSNPNNRSMPEYRSKQLAKERMITNMGKYNYLRLTNNNFEQLLGIIAELKSQMIDDSDDNKKVIININEEVSMLKEEVEMESVIHEASNGYSDAKKIYDSLSDEDKKFVSPNGRFVDSPALAYRYIHKVGKDVAGFIDCYKYNGKSTTSAFIVYAVSSKFRGKGISKILLDKAVSGCKSKGYKKLIYKCDSKNAASAKAAESYGFKLVRSSKNQKSYEMPLGSVSITEASTVDKYKKKYKNFNELCKDINTPMELLEWMYANKVEWEDKDSRGPMHWPDDVVKNHSAICFDQAVFEHYFCEKKGIENVMIHLNKALMNIDGVNKRKFIMGHIMTMFKDSFGGWSAFVYTSPKYSKATKPSILGSYKNMNDLIKHIVSRYSLGIDKFYKLNTEHGSANKLNTVPYPDTSYRIFDSKYMKKLDTYYGNTDIGRDEMNAIIYKQLGMKPIRQDFTLYDFAIAQVKFNGKKLLDSISLALFGESTNLSSIQESSLDEKEFKVKFVKKLHRTKSYRIAVSSMDDNQREKFDSNIMNKFNSSMSKFRTFWSSNHCTESVLLSFAIGVVLGTVGVAALPASIIGSYAADNTIKTLYAKKESVSLAPMDEAAEIILKNITGNGKNEFQQWFRPEQRFFNFVGEETIKFFDTHKDYGYVAIYDDRQTDKEKQRYAYEFCNFIQGMSTGDGFLDSMKDALTTLSGILHIELGKHQWVSYLILFGDETVEKIFIVAFDNVNEMLELIPIQVPSESTYRDKINMESTEEFLSTLVDENDASISEGNLVDIPKPKNVEWITSTVGKPNPYVMVDGKQYRVRIETIVFRDGKVLVEKQGPELNKYNTTYKLPGGGIEKGIPIEKQAAEECKEEARVITKHMCYTGLTYVQSYNGKYPEWHKEKLWPVGLKYEGSITFIFVAEYSKPYKGYIHANDRDSFVDKAKWYDPDTIDWRVEHMAAIEFYNNHKSAIEEGTNMETFLFGEFTGPGGMTPAPDLAYVTQYGPVHTDTGISDENVEGYAISNDMLTKNVIVRDKDGIIKKENTENFFKGRKIRMFRVESATDGIRIIENAINTYQDRGFIYESITGKQLLSDDQVLCDESFTEVSPIEIGSERNAIVQTLAEEFNSIKGKKDAEFPLTNYHDIKEAEQLTAALEDVAVLENQHGVYAKNTKTGRRTAYYKRIKDIPVKVVAKKK